MQVAIFIPCFIDKFYPNTALNMVKVLERAGCSAHYCPEQTCCGQPAFNAGFWSQATHVATKFITDFANYHPGIPIICPSASCTGFLKNYLKTLLPVTTEVNDTAIRVIEFSDFMVNRLKTPNVGASFYATATYHSSCSALRECKLNTEPLQLLKNVKGLTLRDLPDADTCCGFGGTFSIKYPSVSVGMAEAKIKAVLQIPDVQYIISADTSCLMHLQGYMNKHQLPLKTLHLADVLAMQA